MYYVVFLKHIWLKILNIICSENILVFFSIVRNIHAKTVLLPLVVEYFQIAILIIIRPNIMMM